MRKLFASLLGVALAASVTLVASAETYKIDPVHSAVGFKIRHFFSKVPGQFKEFEGTITIDSSDVSKSKAEATIKTASLDTANAKRDEHLRSADFFDAEKHPTITFKSTGWKQIEKDVYVVTGDLTIHGTTKPATLQVKALGSGPDGSGKIRAGWEATTTVDRTAFGVSWNKAVEGGGTILGTDVEIALNIEGIKQ